MYRYIYTTVECARVGECSKCVDLNIVSKKHTITEN